MTGYVMCVCCVALLILTGTTAQAEPRQITFDPYNHSLDNNDNFSPDNRFLVYDTRESIGPGLDHSQSIEKVEIATGKIAVLHTAEKLPPGKTHKPGIAAASYSRVFDRVVFIHGPLFGEVPVRGDYGKPNRTGMEVYADGSDTHRWVDLRDIATDRDTLPGAHRGGTHRHEYSLDGTRIGFTYDDFLVTEYGRTIGFMQEHPEAPGSASHYFTLLVRPVPMGTAKTGEIEVAIGDSWVGVGGEMRAFIGKVKEADGSYQDSLFVVDVPLDLDITTADAGSATRYPTPAKGLTIRRLTHAMAKGIVRGSHQGDRIAYYANDENGVLQVFLIDAHGSDKDPDPAKRPIQATFFDTDAYEGLRWHPSGNSICCMHDNAVAVTCVVPGPKFGKTVYLSPRGEGPLCDQLVWSWDGKTLAYNKPTPSKGPDGEIAKTYADLDFMQIYVVDFPDTDGDGVADSL